MGIGKAKVLFPVPCGDIVFSLPQVITQMAAADRTGGLRLIHDWKGIQSVDLPRGRSMPQGKELPFLFL